MINNASNKINQNPISKNQYSISENQDSRFRSGYFSLEEKEIKHKSDTFSIDNAKETKELIKDIYLSFLKDLQGKDVTLIEDLKGKEVTLIEDLKQKIGDIKISEINKNPTVKDFQLKIQGQDVKKYVKKELKIDNEEFKIKLIKAEFNILRRKLNQELKKDSNNKFNFQITLNNNRTLESKVEHVVDTNPSILKEYLKVRNKTSTVMKYFIKFIKFIRQLFNKTNVKSTIENNTLNDIDYPINLYKHIIKLNNKEEERTIIRNGHIHSLEAARLYLEKMIVLSNFTDDYGNKVIVDNRLMYDVRFRESDLINNHIKFINAAIEEHNAQNPNNKVRIINFNLQPQYMFGISTSNINKFIEFNNMITNNANHIDLSQNDYKYKFIYNMLEYVINNPSKFISTGGENGYNLGFILEYLSTSLGIGFSEGCKSNKDRGSMKKLNDEWFYAKLNLLSEEELQKLKFKDFFKLDDKNINTYKEIYHNNSSNLITMLNTKYPGNKNFSAMGNKLKEVIDGDLKELVGMSKYAKS
jgi:hypothetical protein